MSRILCAALLALAALAPASAEWGAVVVALPEHARASAAAEDPALDALRDLLDAARKARKEKDHAAARARIAEAIEKAFAEPAKLGEREDAAALELLERMGRFALDCGELRSAEKAQRRVLDVRSRTLSEDDRDLQSARLELASTRSQLGDLQGARALIEQVVAVFSRTLPEDHADLQAARLNLAATMYSLGDLKGARSLFEKVLEVYTRILPEEHPNLQVARLNVALTLKALGDLQGARALQEKVLEVCTRTLPEDAAELQSARTSLASTLYALGDDRGARSLFEKVLEVLARVLPEDHPELQQARLNLAALMKEQGDPRGALPLIESVVAAYARNLPADHPHLQLARMNLGNTLATLGDLEGARVLQEQVLEVRTRTLPDDHPDVQRARENLAVTLYTLGDLPGARALQEKQLEVRSRSLTEEHPDLQRARQGLAATLYRLGDLQGARALQEKVLEASSRSLPEDHPDLQAARANLANTIASLGDRRAARVLQEKVLEIYSRSLHADHKNLQLARQNLAVTLEELGDLQGAKAIEESVLAVFSRTLPGDHPDLQRARENLAWTHARELARAVRATEAGGEPQRALEQGRKRCVELVDAACRARTAAARAALLGSSAREAEERCAELSDGLDVALSFAGGLGILGPVGELEHACFALSETTRGAALGAAALVRRAAGTPRHAELRQELRERSGELATLVQTGASSESFRQALERRESVERELAQLAHELAGGRAPALDFDADLLAAALADGAAVVAWRRYERSSLARPGTRDTPAGPGAPGSPEPPDPATGAAPVERSVDSLCAFVVRSRGGQREGHVRHAGLTLVELGPVEPIERAVRAWRDAIGVDVERGVGLAVDRSDAVRSRGAELRQLVLDPLEDALAGADRVILVLDDVLHLVTLDALPAGGTADPVSVALGDRRRFETRCTLTELLALPAARAGASTLVSLGGASFNSGPLGPGAEDPGAPEAVEPDTTAVAAILRGGPWEHGFPPLTYTGLEAREVAALHDEALGEHARSVVLEKRKASRAALDELAPGARFLHVATHGWFASASIRSWKDEEPLDGLSGLGARLPGAEQVKGMSPMLLCGLALAGANLPANEVGRVPGLITAEELAALDLSNCELAVLSACDTNVGEQRAGQGVASLQRALQMAGARSVITSLWKVPDGATRELMTDFYRRIWIEKKPKAQALWEAKRRLREAKDERGEPRYTTRDWAAWVLTGAPD